jgi:hypothetical protein
MTSARKTIAILSMTVLIVLALFYYLNDKYMPKASADVNVITGDIFANTLEGTIKIGSGSTVSQGATIYIPNQQPKNISSGVSTAAYSTFVNKIKASKDRLIKGRPLDSCNFSGSVDLNPSKTPEGKLWYCSGPLTISGNVTFTGKGTIYVAGKLTINGNLTYDTGTGVNSLGVIADGDIDIGSSVSQLVGVYYSDGTINIQ